MPVMTTYGKDERGKVFDIKDNGHFYARDVKVVKTNLMSETLKSSVKCVFEMHLKRRCVICQTLNASVMFTVFILDIKVVSRQP